MSDQNSVEFEHAMSEQDDFDAVIRDGDRRRSPAMEWTRTLILCCLLLGGLLMILPMMPDKDSRGMDTSHHAAALVHLSSNVTSNLSLRDVLISQPMSGVRRTGDNHLHT